MGKTEERVLKALIPAIEQIDFHCHVCIGDFVRQANGLLANANVEYSFIHETRGNTVMLFDDRKQKVLG